MPTSGTVEDRDSRVAPALPPGTITPELLYRWERSCKEFFRVKNVSKTKQVESVIWQLKDLRIAHWAEVNEMALIDLDFAAFMEKLRGEALEKDWDRKIRLAMLASKQGERPFHEWAYELQNRNALLRGRPCHFNDAALRQMFRNNMDPHLELRSRLIMSHSPDLTIRGWIEKVKVKGEKIAEGRALMERLGKLMGDGASLPRLTPAERSLIFDHQGCFKCRQLYVNHKAANCPNGFPPAVTYKTLTAEYAESVRDSKNKARSQNLGRARLPRLANTNKYVRYHGPPPFPSGRDSVD